MPRVTHPPPLQGGLIAAGGTTTGRTELDSVEILDRYYCKFKPPSSSYQSLIVVGLKSRKWASFFFSRSARMWRIGPRLPRKLEFIRGGLFENIFTIISGRDDGDNARKEVGVCRVVRRVWVFVVCWNLVVIFVVSSIPNCFDDPDLHWSETWHVECYKQSSTPDCSKGDVKIGLTLSSHCDPISHKT